MSRPDRSEQPTELDALLARPTPAPTPEEAVSDDSDEQPAPSTESRPVRSRLEAWLRGGGGPSRDEEHPDSPLTEIESPERPEPEPASEDAGGSATGSTSPTGHEAGDPYGGAGLVAGDSPRPASPSADEASEPVAVGGASFELVSVGAIEANAYQPRRQFDEDGLAALTESVREVGVLQPVLVRPPVDGRYELVAGERRWRAARRAGLRMIPVIIRPTNDRGALEHAIIENLHREDLNPLEEAAAYRQLAEEFGLSQEAVAKRVGKSRPAVANSIRLLGLPTTVQRLVREGELSAGHARALLSLPEVASQLLVAKEALEKGWTVRQLEAEVRRRIDAGPDFGSQGAAGSSTRRDTDRKSIGALEAESVLSDALQTRVEVQPARRGGRLVVRYADEDDLGRLVEQLRSAGEGSPES